MKRKRLLAAILCAVMMLTLMPTAVMAAALDKDTDPDCRISDANGVFF